MNRLSFDKLMGMNLAALGIASAVYGVSLFTDITTMGNAMASPKLKEMAEVYVNDDALEECIQVIEQVDGEGYPTEICGIVIK